MVGTVPGEPQDSITTCYRVVLQKIKLLGTLSGVVQKGKSGMGYRFGVGVRGEEWVGGWVG